MNAVSTDTTYLREQLDDAYGSHAVTIVTNEGSCTGTIVSLDGWQVQLSSPPGDVPFSATMDRIVDVVPHPNVSWLEYTDGPLDQDNGTLQPAGSDVAVSITTQVRVPASVPRNGLQAVAAHVAAALSDGDVTFSVQVSEDG